MGAPHDARGADRFLRFRSRGSAPLCRRRQSVAGRKGRLVGQRRSGSRAASLPRPSTTRRFEPGGCGSGAQGDRQARACRQPGICRVGRGRTRDDRRLPVAADPIPGAGVEGAAGRIRLPRSGSRRPRRRTRWRESMFRRGTRRRRSAPAPPLNGCHRKSRSSRARSPTRTRKSRPSGRSQGLLSDASGQPASAEQISGLNAELATRDRPKPPRPPRLS